MGECMHLVCVPCITFTECGLSNIRPLQTLSRTQDSYHCKQDIWIFTLMTLVWWNVDMKSTQAGLWLELWKPCLKFNIIWGKFLKPVFNIVQQEMFDMTFLTLTLYWMVFVLRVLSEVSGADRFFTQTGVIELEMIKSIWWSVEAF